MDLIKELMNAAEKGVRGYAAMSRPADLKFPENWLQCSIATHFYEEFRFDVVLEASTKSDRWDSEGISFPFEKYKDGRMGRCDLLIFDQESQKRYVVEAKGPRSNWSQFGADAVRVEQLVGRCDFTAGALIYATCLMTSEKLESERVEFERIMSEYGGSGVSSHVGPFDDPLGSKRTWQVCACFWKSNKA